MPELFDSDSILLYEEVLNFDPFSCKTPEEAAGELYALGKGINRSSLYMSYAIGKFVDTAKLKSKYGITSINQLAKIMHTSVNTLLRYRDFNATVTANEVKKLADNGVSINAILELSNVKDKYPQETRKVLDLLVQGTLADATALGVNQALVSLIEKRISPCNLLPGGEQSDDTEEKPLRDIINGSEAEPAEAIIADDAIWGEEGKIEEPDKKKEKEAASADEPDTQNLRDIKVILKNVHNWAVKLKRELRTPTESLKEQLDKIQEKEDVVLGDEDSYDEFIEEKRSIYEQIQATVEYLTPFVKEGLDNGMLKRPCVLPKAAEIQKLFRNEA